MPTTTGANVNITNSLALSSFHSNCPQFVVSPNSVYSFCSKFFDIIGQRGLLQHQHTAYGIELSKYGSMLGESIFSATAVYGFLCYPFPFVCAFCKPLLFAFRIDPFRNVRLIVLKEPENKSLALSLLKIPVLCFPSTPINGAVEERLEAVGWLVPSWLVLLGKGCCSFGTASFL